MMRPQRWACMCGTARRAHRKTLRRSTRSISSHIAVDMSAQRDWVSMPALLTRMSMPPKACTQRSMMRWAVDSSPTSPMTVSACVPSARQRRATSSARAASMSASSSARGLRIGQGNGLADAAAGACHDGAAAVQWLDVLMSDVLNWASARSRRRRQ